MRDQIKSCHICYVWDFQHFLVLVIEITTLNIIWMEFYFFLRNVCYFRLI